jgi:hypothetical protein
MTAQIAYTNANDAEPAARLRWVLDDVQQQDLDGLAALRMPRVTVQSVTTQYASDAVRAQVADLSRAVSLSEATLLRLLPVPVPYQRAADALARSDGRARRIHIEPLLSGVVIEGLHRSAGPASVNLMIERLELDRLALARSSGQWWVQHLRLGVAGAHLPLDALGPPVRELLRDAGYEEPELDGALVYDHRPESGNIALDPIHLRSEAMGTLDGELRLQGVDPGALRRQPQVSLIGAAFERAGVSYNDAGLVGRLVEALAEQRNTSAARVRTWLRRRAAMIIAERLGARRQAVMPAIDSFLRDPQRLTLSAEPAEPVPMRLLIGPASMGHYGSLAERLVVTAELGN